jgi:glycosyltransferase involved in cell wall biosynthesis
MPIVSVLLPVYNGANFLEEAISSVLSQSFEDFELIIRDNQSSDRSREIVECFEDPRIVFAQNKTNLGLFGNINGCLALALGEFVHLFSHDDVMHTNCLESQVRFLREHTEAAMAYCGMRAIDAHGKILGDSLQDSTPEIISRDLYLSLAAHYGSLPASASTVIIRKQILNQVGVFDNDMQVAADCDLWNRIADRYPIARNPMIVMDIRSHRQQVTNASLSGLFYIKEDIRIMEWYRSRFSPERWAQILRFRTRTRAVTYWAWIIRQIVRGRIFPAINGIHAMAKGYNPLTALGYFCLSVNGRLFRPQPQIEGD